MQQHPLLPGTHRRGELTEEWHVHVIWPCGDLAGSLRLLLPGTQRCWGLPQHRKWLQRLEGHVCGKSRDQIGSTPVKITERACVLYFLANMLQLCLAVTCT
eukprot:1109610-Pelagomonas_calceolata.AAC.1